MKILIISDAWEPQVNGVVRTYQHLRDELVAMGHTVKIIGPDSFPVTFPMPGYGEIRLVLFPYKKLQRMIMDFAPDHIHLATEGPLGWAGRRFCQSTQHPFTTSYHTQFPDYIAKRVAQYMPFLEKTVRAAAIKVLKFFHATSRTVFVATQSLEQDLREMGFAMPMARLSRGVRLDTFNPDGEKVDLPGRNPVALYVGRIAIEKNLEAFLEMDWSGAKVLIGKGPSLAMLKKKYPDAHFIGEKVGADLAAWYRSCDLFVFPSRTDTFGIVLIEAMASGLPIAAYPVTGPKDIVTEPFHGVLHENLSYAAHQALHCGDRHERARFAQEHYSWHSVARDFVHSLEAAKT